MITITGNGLIFPLARDGRGDFATGSGVEAINASLRNILGVRGAGADTQGELRWRTEFGSQIHRLRFADNTEALEDIARVFVVDAVRRYEPRVDLRAATVERFDVAGYGLTGLRVRLAYTLRNTRTPENRAYTTTVEL